MATEMEPSLDEAYPSEEHLGVSVRQYYKAAAIQGLATNKHRGASIIVALASEIADKAIAEDQAHQEENDNA